MAAAVIGGYLGLLPLLSSLAAGPAWPDPIATRDASGVITVTAISAGEPAQGDGTTSSPEVDPLASENGDAPTETTGGDEATPVSHPKPATKSTNVSVVVKGGLERVTPKPKPAIVVRPTGGGSSGGSASGGSSGGSSGGGSSAGGSGGGSATPTPNFGQLDGIGPGQVAGGGQQDNGDDEASAGG